LRVTQLAEQHRDHLRPTGETAGVPLGFALLYRGLKLQTRNQTQNLTEYAAYSIQGETSVRWFGSLAGTQFNVTGVSPPSPPCHPLLVASA
jgi:hypothetical protein